MLALALFALYPSSRVCIALHNVTNSDWIEMQTGQEVCSTEAPRPPQSRCSHSLFRRAGARTTSDRGASALEFALVIPVLLLLLFGIIEFGVIFQNQLALTHAAREGARMAAVGQWNVTTVKARAYPVVPTVTVSPATPSTTPHGTAITVTLTYNYDWVLLPFPGTIQLKSQAVMRRE